MDIPAIQKALIANKLHTFFQTQTPKKNTKFNIGLHKSSLLRQCIADAIYDDSVKRHVSAASLSCCKIKKKIHIIQPTGLYCSRVTMYFLRSRTFRERTSKSNDVFSYLFGKLLPQSQTMLFHRFFVYQLPLK